MNELKIEIFETFSEQLKKHWLEFEKKSDHHFFQTLKWQKLWFEHQKLKNKSITNYSIIVTELDEIIMIAPFNIDYSGGIKKLKWSGFPFSDYNCPLLRTGKKISREQFKNIWKLILNNSNKDFDCVILKNQPENILNNKNPFFYLHGQKIFNWENFSRKICKKHKCEKMISLYKDFNKIKNENIDWKQLIYIDDDIHMKKFGNSIVADKIIKNIKF